MLNQLCKRACHPARGRIINSRYLSRSFINAGAAGAFRAIGSFGDRVGQASARLPHSIVDN